MPENNVFQEQEKKVETNNNQQSSFDVPVATVSLPSKGLVYPTSHPLCNAETVDIRCLTAREEDILTSPSLLKSGQALPKLIQSCLINKSVDPETLLARR